jgi:hypothetical protein
LEEGKREKGKRKVGVFLERGFPPLFPQLFKRREKRINIIGLTHAKLSTLIPSTLLKKGKPQKRLKSSVGEFLLRKS